MGAYSIINESTETVRIDQLDTHPNNPRSGDVGAIHESMRVHGFYGTVIVQRSTGYVLAGNHRLLAARQAGMAEIPVTFVDVDDETALRILISDNRSSDLGSYDDSELLDILQQLDSTPQGLDGLGYDTDDLNDIAHLLDGFDGASSGESGSSHIDRADELQDKWQCKSGDIWRADEQLLIVGDSTDPLVWATVNETVGPISMLMTSPPYLQQRDYTKQIDDWDGLMQGVFSAFDAAEQLDDAQAFVNLGLVHREREVMRYWDLWLVTMRSMGWLITGWYVWDQGPGMPGASRGRLASSHEFVFHLAKQSRKAHKTKKCLHAGETQSATTGHRQKDGSMKPAGNAGKKIGDYKIADSVLRVNRQQDTTGAQSSHPAIFPPDVPREYIDAFSKRDDVVIDPFVGSGSTLLAAHDLSRRGVGIEIEPKYAAVVLERLSDAGLSPELLQ